MAKLASGGRLSGLRTAFFALAYVIFILLAPFSQVKTALAPVAEAMVDQRIIRLEAFLAKYNSPLTPYAATFVAVSDRYGLDWRLLPAIAGTESTFGKVHVVGTYNPFGWGSGWIWFNSWEDGMETVGRGLFEKYYLSGTRPLTIEELGSIYAQSPHWPRSVRFFMNKLDTPQISVL